MTKSAFDPVVLGSSGVELKNRLVMAPMTTQSGFYDGAVTEELLEYYAHRSGDASMIIVESCFVENDGRGFPGAIGIDTDQKVYGLSRLAKAIKDKGSVAVAQIYHAGRMAWPEYNGGAHPIAPSTVAALRPNAPVPREMSHQQIEEMIQMFGDATRRAIEAGFDGVEIHGANTFLIQQFFSPHSNRRTDHWGGSRSKRAVFPEEVMKIVQQTAQEMGKENFIVGYRFSPEELEEPGIRFEDTMYLLNRLAKLSPSYFHFSMGAYDRTSIVDTKDQEPLITKYLAHQSAALEAIPIIGVGSILQATDAQNALDLGYDILAAGKAFLVEPNWVKELADEHEVIDYAHVEAQQKLLIPEPLWCYMEYMIIDPEEEKRKHERIKELQNMPVEFKPGTYQVEAAGHSGALPMEVTFSEDRIEKIYVDKSGESEGLSDQVFEVLPQQIIDGQTLNVDIISGASASSEGLIKGVTDAVELAGGNVEVLQARPKAQVQWSDEVEEEEVDVVVVGGGAAGIAAALRADELGLSVILLEKMSFIGGAISISGGNQVVMGSKLQHACGVTDDTPELMAEDFMINGEHKNVKELLKLFTENVGTATDWLNEYVGIQYNTEEGLHNLPEYRKHRELAYADGGHGFARTARLAVKDSNVKLYLQTKAEKLYVNEDGQITGIRAVEDTGKTHEITAKAVIITTGGYGNNQNLLSDELKEVLYYGPTSATGDGITLATANDVKAATRLMDYGKIYPNGIEVSEGFAKSTIGGNIAVLRENALLVDIHGDRVVNERASNHDILKVLMEQDPTMLYILLDQEHFEIFKNAVDEGGISHADVERWLNNNGSTTPYFYHAETLEELAALAGMDDYALADTVNRYNEFVEQGEDIDFGRQTEFLQKKIGAGPYYLVEQKPRFATTMGGLVANYQLEVINESGKVIDGLYAAGETVGGVMGTDSPSGANNAWALTSGKLAAESAKSQI